MPASAVNVAVVFADIAGSTQLYEALGDARAQRVVTQCLRLMEEVVRRCGGRVVKTIGDEIMAAFPEVEPAVEACIEIQEAVTERLPHVSPDTPKGLKVRVGLHHGAALEDGGDVFGDAVNVAARMTDLAKGGQIILTRSSADALPPDLQRVTRQVDRLDVRGKSEYLDICEVLWQPQEVVTRMSTAARVSIPTGDHPDLRLLLRYRGQEITLRLGGRPFVLGRGDTADLHVADSLASREHCCIECRRGRFVLVDHSTNGTYVALEGGVGYLRRQEVELSGTGRISLGRSFGNEPEEVVHFLLEG